MKTTYQIVPRPDSTEQTPCTFCGTPLDGILGVCLNMACQDKHGLSPEERVCEWCLEPFMDAWDCCTEQDCSTGRDNLDSIKADSAYESGMEVWSL